MKLFFCKDGILRVYSDPHTPMLPCTFIQEEMNLEGSDFSFFARFLTREATFEKGLTFQMFLKCLSPWVDFWSEFCQVDIHSYLQYVNRPHVIETSSYVDSIEFSTFTNVENAISYIIDNKLVRAEDVGFLSQNFANKFDPTLAIGASFNIQNMFYLRGYSSKVEHFSFDISSTPLIEYMYAPLTLRKKTNVIFSEEGTKSFMEMNGKSSRRQPSSSQLVFSKNFVGNQRLVTGSSFEDDSFSYIEGDYTFSLEELMREMFRFMPVTPITEANQYSLAIHKAFNLAKEYEDKISHAELSAMIGEILEDIWEEAAKKYEEENYLPSDAANESFEEPSPNSEFKENNSSEDKVLQLNPQKKLNTTSKDNNDSKVLSLADFKHKKTEKSSEYDVDYAEIDAAIENPAEADHLIFKLMIKEAQIQNIELKDAFSVEQNYQPENRVMGILQTPSLETFDPISFIENNDDIGKD